MLALAGPNLALKASLAPRVTVTVPAGQDTFTDAPIGTPLSATPGWDAPQNGAPTDLVLAPGGGVQTGTTPTNGDVVVAGPNPATQDRIITGTVGDATQNVGSIGVYVPDPNNYLALNWNPGTSKIDLLQKIGGNPHTVPTAIQQTTAAVAAMDVLSAVVKGGFLWTLLNGSIINTPVALHALWTNQQPGLIINNPLGIEALFLKRFTWAGIVTGYGCAYGLSYGN